MKVTKTEQVSRKRQYEKPKAKSKVSKFSRILYQEQKKLDNRAK